MINGKNFNTHLVKTRVLVAPLDWGLGHATRCIPIINELIEQNCEVLIAGEESVYFLLKKEFPEAIFLPIKSYKIKYSHSGNRLFLKLLLQFPKVIFSVVQENLWLKKIINEYKIEAVISDNRFGLYHKKIPSVYITHQLYIKTGKNFTDKIARKLHYYFIKKYKHCWVPDSEENSLAGKLSHPQKKPSNVLYIGPLSRFEKTSNVGKKYDLLISLSGPEPQRTIFEQIILSQLENFGKEVLLVRGLPNENKIPAVKSKSVTIENHFPAKELNMAFQESEMVISRSGYSTIMDLVKIGKKAILVPTPGQGEQEYLSKYLMEKKYFYAVQQDNFSLGKNVSEASLFHFAEPIFSFNDYKKVVSEFALSFKSGNFTPQ